MYNQDVSDYCFFFAVLNLSSSLYYHFLPYVSVQENPKPVKVILLAYFRGGSSFVGKLFDMNPNAIYMFEPMDALFSSIYGTEYGLSPFDIYTNLDGSFR